MDFLISCKTELFESHQILGSLLLNKPYFEINEITMPLMKVVLLTLYFNKKTNFRMIKLILDFKNRHRKLKIVTF